MKRTIFTFVIGAIASLQILGYAANSRTIRGLGLASGISPYPKVFCEAEGYEPFAASFKIKSNKEPDITLTAKRYSQLQGPYMRRNVYGAALAYAPRLPEDLRAHLFARIFAETSSLPEELNMENLVNPSIQISPRSGETPTLYEYQLRNQ